MVSRDVRQQLLQGGCRQPRRLAALDGELCEVGAREGRPGEGLNLGGREAQLAAALGAQLALRRGEVEDASGEPAALQQRIERRNLHASAAA